MDTSSILVDSTNEGITSSPTVVSSLMGLLGFDMVTEGLES